MLSKCANPACEAKFRYLYEGKVFFADWVAGTGSQDAKDACWRRTEMFWLCDSCSRKFVLTKRGSAVVPVGMGESGGTLLRELRIDR